MRGTRRLIRYCSDPLAQGENADAAGDWQGEARLRGNLQLDPEGGGVSSQPILNSSHPELCPAVLVVCIAVRNTSAVLITYSVSCARPRSAIAFGGTQTCSKIACLSRLCAFYCHLFFMIQRRE